MLNAIGAGAWLTLGPALAGETIGRQAWGWVLSAEAAGALVATLVLLRVALPRPLLVGMVAVSLLGIPMVVLGLDPRVGLLVVASFVAGIGLEVFGMGWNLAMQENVDEGQLSRAYSYDALGSFVAMPVGQLVYGPLGDRFGYAGAHGRRVLLHHRRRAPFEGGQETLDLADIRDSLRSLMWRAVGITRDGAGLAEAADQVEFWPVMSSATSSPTRPAGPCKTC